MRTNRKLIALFTLASASLLFQTHAIGQSAALSDADLCTHKSDVIIPFFNGVNTTYSAAQTALIHMRKSFGTAAPNGDKIRYESLYNWTNGVVEDALETFVQRAHEENLGISNKYELFWETFHGGGPLTTAVTKAVPGYEKTVASLYSGTRAATIISLRALEANLPTIDNYVEQRERLNAYLLAGNKVVMFAHSQGNLFANVAYDYLAPKATRGSVKVVHVAPASPTLRGPWTLADKDVIINTLRITGTVAANTDVIPFDRLPGVNNETDMLGHGLAEIYLNPALPDTGVDANGIRLSKPFTRIKTDVDNALGTLVEPPRPKKEATGFFSVKLTWDGPGGVDLHVIEPTGTHVYYANPFGNGGTLSGYTNFMGGPEQYQATCKSQYVVPGDYKIGVNHFWSNHDLGPKARKATVQVSTWDHGVLAEQTLDLGLERGLEGNKSPIPVFTVTLAKNPTSGKYFITAKQALP